MSAAPAVEATAAPDLAPPDLAPREFARAARRILLVMVAVGVAVRLVRLLLGSPVWGDEAMLALNIIDRDYAGLTRHLDHAQVAPVLFLWAERLVMTNLGTSEWAVRFVPFLAAVGGLFLFWDFARRSLPPAGAALAVGLLAVSAWPVSMAATLKPYSFDLFWATLLLALAARWHRRPERVGPLAGLVAAVPLALAGSYPAVFVAGAVSVYLLPVAWRAGPRAQVLFAAYNLAMFGAFAGVYLLVGAAQVDPDAGRTGEYMRWYWRDGFPPDSVPRVPLWLLQAHTGRAFAYPIGDHNGASALTTLLAAVGAYWCWRTGSRALLVLCAVPFALNLLAAMLGKYPYMGCCRLAQHLAPAICLMAGAGWAAVMEWWSPRRDTRLRLLRWAAATLIAFAIGVLVERCVNHDRDEVSRFSKNLHRELVLETAAADRVVAFAQPGTDATTVWYLRRLGDRVVWANPGGPLPAADRVWVLSLTRVTPDRAAHVRNARPQPGWHAGAPIWYAMRPGNDGDPRAVWWYCGVTCLTRAGDPRPAPKLNATP